MSICINYELRSECSGEELAGRLRRIRRKVRRWEGVSVGQVRHLEPICDVVLFRRLQDRGIALPAEVAERLEMANAASEEIRDLAFDIDIGMTFPKPQRYAEKLHRPALLLSKQKPEWESKDLPEELCDEAFGFKTWSCNRGYMLFKFACSLLRHGYSLPIRLGPGCEWLHLWLGGYHSDRSPMWYGWSFTKTQYAENFVRDHDNVCRILDLADQEGLVKAVSDGCQYYKHRDWTKSAPLVNRETAFIRFASSLIDAGIVAANRQGAEIQTLSDPIKQSQNYIVVDPESKPHRR